MSPKTTGWNELHLAESPAVELLQSLVYAYIAPVDLDPERTRAKEPTLTRRPAAAVKRLNPGSSTPTSPVPSRPRPKSPPLASPRPTGLCTSLTCGVVRETDLGARR